MEGLLIPYSRLALAVGAGKSDEKDIVLPSQSVL
jgi:hypothetical protein